MDMVRTQELPSHNEKEGGKLAVKFSVFKVRVDPELTSCGCGSADAPEEIEEKAEPDDEADFDVSEEDVQIDPKEEEEEEAPEEPPEPEWLDLENGPLRGAGPFDVEPHIGKPRFECATVRPVKKPQKLMLQDGQGFYSSYSIDQGYFSTVTRVVAATADGLPKVIISYAASAVTTGKTNTAVSALTPICALSGHLFPATSAAVTVTTAQAGKLHPIPGL